MVKFLLFILFIVNSTVYAENTPQVTVTIKPLHALVSGVMAGVAQPYLLLPDGQSPHAYSLRPSQVKQLAQADLVIWVGLETFLEKTLTRLPTQSFKLLEMKGLTLLKVRQWSTLPHTHPSDHDLGVDPHIWLDPKNAQVIVTALADHLSQIDASHGPRYRDNATRLNQQLTELDQALQQQLNSLRNLPFLVFHDAYQYFENRYGLTAKGALSLSPEQSPSVKHLHELRKLIKDLQVRCVFREPQFESALVTALIQDTSARAGTLDPLGTQLPTGPDAYFSLLRNLANSLENCLLK